jgi:hypothetical protein
MLLELEILSAVDNLVSGLVPQLCRIYPGLELYQNTRDTSIVQV